MSDATSQTPPADELADVRARIKALQEREGEIKSLMYTDKSARTGNRFVAEVKEFTVSRMDQKELRKMHPAIAEEYTYQRSETRIELSVIDDETGEITRHRQTRNTKDA